MAVACVRCFVYLFFLCSHITYLRTQSTELALNLITSSLSPVPPWKWDSWLAALADDTVDWLKARTLSIWW